MNNIIVVGDSFCATAHAWPSSLASRLGLNLICHGEGGQAWWNSRMFLNTLSADCIDQTEVMIFVHTNAERIPTSNLEIGKINHSASPVTELEHAIQLYFKHIFEPEFLYWAQDSWFKEISQRYADKKIVHLHSFPWSRRSEHLLKGLNIRTNLCAISLNELGAEEFTLIHDHRLNHLNDYNNKVLAAQLAEKINQYSEQSMDIDASQYEHKTLRWLNWN